MGLFGSNKGVNDANQGKQAEPQGGNESATAFKDRTAAHAAQTQKNNDKK